MFKHQTNISKAGSRGEKKKQEKMAQLLEAKKHQERMEFKKNVGDLKKGITDVGASSFKIVHLSSKMAGEEAKKFRDV